MGLRRHHNLGMGGGDYEDNEQENSRIKIIGEPCGFRILPLLPPEPLFDMVNMGFLERHGFRVGGAVMVERWVGG